MVNLLSSGDFKRVSVGLFSSLLLLSSPVLAHSLSGTSSFENQPIQDIKSLPKPAVQNQMGSFVSNLKNQKISVTQLTSNWNSWLSLDSDHSFHSTKTERDALGITHQNFQHFYKGIPVEGDLIMVHSQSEIVLSVNGQLIPQTKEQWSKKAVSAKKSSSTASSALEIAKAYVNATELIRTYPEETVYTKIETPSGMELKLTKKVRIDSFSPLVMCYVYIDLETSQVVNKVNLLSHADVPGTAKTYYRGVEAITVDDTDQGYRLKDNARNIHTLDATKIRMDRNTGEFIGTVEYTNATAHFENNPALDAHWAMEQSFDFYKNRFDRNSYDNLGSIIINYYNPVWFKNLPDSGYPNNAGAFPEPYNFMAYGAGDGVNFDPVVGLDVAGHEYTHMIVSKNGNGGLIYQGESGALNESFADIFGTAIEFYVNQDPNWTIGERIYLTQPYMRSMSAPKSANNPDTYKGQHWINTSSNFDNGGVHINSGVQNYWFYLLSQGGSGVNDLSNNYFVEGIGIEKATEIAYRNLVTYLGPQATFFDALTGSVQAAKDLYGDQSSEVQSVLAAWYAVGIGEENLSVDKQQISLDLKVYPNPTLGGKFQVYSNLTADVQLDLYNLMGKRVLANLLVKTGDNTVDVSHLSNGVYVIQMSHNGSSYTQKLIIQN